MNRKQQTTCNKHFPPSNRTISFLWLFFFYLLPLPGHTQTEEVVIPMEDFLIRVKLWTEKDGIPHWFLGSNLLQDSRGYLWGEWKGTFCRVDGRNFRQIRHRELGLHEFPSSQLAEDVHGNIWKPRSNQFNAGEIEVYVPSQDSLYTLEAYLGKQANALQFTGNNFGLYALGRQVYLVDEGTGRMWLYDGALKEIGTGAQTLPKQADGTKYLPAPDEGKWQISQTEGIRLIDAQGRTLKYYPNLLGTKMQFSFTQDFRLRYHQPDGAVFCLFRDRADSEEDAPVFTPRYCCPFLRQKYPLPQLNGYQLEHKQPRSIQLTRNGKPVIENLLPMLASALPSYAGFFNLNEPAPYPFALIHLGDESFILHIPNGNISLLQFDFQPRYFRTVFQPDYIHNLAVLNDQLLAVKNFYEFSISDLTTHTERTFQKSPKSNAVLKIQAGQLWYAGVPMGVGMIQATPPYSPRRRSPYPSLPGFESGKDLLILSDSLLWLATTDGVRSLNLNTMALSFVLEGCAVQYLYQSRQKDVWACTNRGLFSFAKQRYYLDTLPGGRRISVAHVYEQDSNTFWLATHQGLIRWKPYSEEYQLFTKADGLSDDILHAVYADQRGRLWLSTNHGITSFDPGSGQFMNWFTTEGLAHNEQNFAAHAQGKDGRLYFGGLGGVTMFHPDNIPNQHDTLKYPLLIDKMEFFGKNGSSLGKKRSFIPALKKYRLPRGCHQLDLDLSQPYFGFKTTIVEWRLKQQNDDWRQLDANGNLFLLQIPYGDFEIDFRVRQKGTNNILANYQLFLYNPYPFYYSALFWMIAFLGTIILSFFFILWRIREIKVRNRALQAEVVKRTRELEVQTQKLERVDVAKTQMFNNVSHELRTPLSIIQLSAEQLRARKAPEQTQLVGQIKEQVRYITRMLEEIMDLSRLEMGMIKVEPEVVNWQSFFNQNFRMLESMARYKNQDYHLKIQPAETVYLLIDKDKVAHIFNNLIGNAIKYTPVGGRILVRSELTASEVEVMVADTGPGIPLEEQEDIFRRYYQGRHASKQAQPGYGIGLALCKEYAELMGGRVWVESVPGEGASFFFHFPLVDAPQAEALPDPDAAEVAISHSPRTFSRIVRADTPKNRIMVVEDNLELLALLEDILSKDYEVQLATNGEEAFELLQQQPDAFQLVLSDIMMPVADGFGLLSKVRAHPSLGFIPFLFLSALSAQEDQLKSLRLGVDGFISKPFETLDLKTRIQSMIRNQELRKKYLLSTITDAQNQAAKAPTLSSQEDGAGEAISYNEAWLRELEAIVRKNLAQHDLKIQDIAFQLHISERTLRNYINAYTGLSPLEYLKKARLSQAMQLIQQRKYRTIGEIAHAVGFKDAAYFSKAFKQEFGKYPMDYR